MKRGDIYVVSLDPGEGHEQRGTRPVLVISSDRFNALTRLPIVVPITTGGGFVRNIGYAVSLMGAGTRTIGIIRCDQPRPVDLSARGARKVETVPIEILDEVMARTITVFA